MRQLNGDKEVYSRDVDSMDLVFDPSGKLSQIHLILITNGEKDTHRWYMADNLASFSYRFLNVAGKGKVRLRIVQPRGKDIGSDIPPVQSKDYR